ncbi:MAG: twin-arginine translocation signal domain-containing protein [Coleofasciculaceae cyanobacterium]
MDDSQAQISKTNKYTRRTFLQTSALAAGGILFHGCMSSSNQTEKLVEVLHLPKRFSRRHGEFTANITGVLAPEVKKVRYQLNDGKWIEFSQEGPRVPPPLFVLELRAEELRPGTNELNIEAKAGLAQPELTTVQFEYDPTPIKLPISIDWSNPELDVQDGSWEIFEDNGQKRVRPTPGFEDYDRILAVTGAFAGGRRVETDVIFRSNTKKGKYGFGVLPIWGGHPDDLGVSPRRGWSYGLGWFYSKYNGVGNEFSYKYSDQPFEWVNSYRGLDLKEGVRYLITVECLPEVDQARRHTGYLQRLKWQTEGEQTSAQWIELIDTEGSPLAPGEYAVGLLAHRCQVDFGPVTITSIEA